MGHRTTHLSGTASGALSSSAPPAADDDLRVSGGVVDQEMNTTPSSSAGEENAGWRSSAPFATTLLAAAGDGPSRAAGSGLHQPLTTTCLEGDGYRADSALFEKGVSFSYGATATAAECAGESAATRAPRAASSTVEGPPDMEALLRVALADEAGSGDSDEGEGEATVVTSKRFPFGPDRRASSRRQWRMQACTVFCVLFLLVATVVLGGMVCKVVRDRSLRGDAVSETYAKVSFARSAEAKNALRGPPDAAGAGGKTDTDTKPFSRKRENLQMDSEKLRALWPEYLPVDEQNPHKNRYFSQRELIPVSWVYVTADRLEVVQDILMPKAARINDIRDKFFHSKCDRLFWGNGHERDPEWQRFSLLESFFTAAGVSSSAGDKKLGEFAREKGYPSLNFKCVDDAAIQGVTGWTDSSIAESAGKPAVAHSVQPAVAPAEKPVAEPAEKPVVKPVAELEEREDEDEDEFFSAEEDAPTEGEAPKAEVPKAEVPEAEAPKPEAPPAKRSWRSRLRMPSMPSFFSRKPAPEAAPRVLPDEPQRFAMDPRYQLDTIA